MRSRLVELTGEMSRGRLILIAVNALLLLIAVIALVIQHLTEPPGITATTTFTIEVTRSMAHKI